MDILYQNPADFHDITSGTSDGHPNYSAGPGYDLVTGLGSPIANLVVGSLVGSPAVSYPVGLQQVNLASSYNRNGIVTDGSTFSGTGGLDGDGSALSANLLGTSQTWMGTTFAIGPAGSSDVVSATGQTIALPAGQDGSLDLLATGVNGSQPNRTFTVNYSDGTTATFTQSISDWFTPQNYSGESEAVTMAYRDLSNGTKDNRTFYLYGYTFALNSAKTVTSLTLPNDANVELVAATLVPTQSATSVSLSGAFNRTGIYADGSTFASTGGLDGGGAALSANLLGTSQTWMGTTFAIGPAGSSDVVSATGQTIALPAGQDGSLDLLATGVDGNQPNLTFTVNYSDGTTATFTQSVSDWFTPQNYSGESEAVTMAYRDLSNGTKDNRTFYLYGYTFALNSAKTVSSVTLPNDADVELVAATLVPAQSATSVSLSGAFNRTGIYADGSTFSSTGGLDGGGAALSANLLGTSQSWMGTTFAIGPAGSSDVVSATGQTIALPAGQDVSLDLLATGVDGNQPNLTFTVNYSDGTTAKFTQSISDWFTPQNYSGESEAVTMAYRDLSNGTQDNRTFYLYGYTFALNSAKTVSSLTLPNQANVKVLAIDLLS